MHFHIEEVSRVLEVVIQLVRGYLLVPFEPSTVERLGELASLVGGLFGAPEPTAAAIPSYA
ncbi:MAG TPA: hypothetical protein VF129_01575 [Actinomycetota bacterium]